MSVAFNGTTSFRILLSVPFLALTFSVLAIYHDSVVHHLHLYIKRVDKESWDNSKERSNYSKSIFRWSYFIAQILAFVGTSCFALWLNKDACTDENFCLIWWVDLVMMIVTSISLIGIRIWRVLKE